MDFREKLIDLIGEAIELYPSERKELADGLIANGVTVQEWISVNDRLPDKPMKCLVYTKRGECGGYEITYYNQGFNLQYSNVTHWMPIPQPPKGE